MPSKKKKYNARFPPARIKKIMQTDDEVGKVAAPVPVIISRALELFVESLLMKTNEITQSRNAKTLTTLHLKQCILAENKFDFLKDLVASVPDVQVEDETSNSSLNAATLGSSSLAPEGAKVERTKPKILRIKRTRNKTTPENNAGPSNSEEDSENDDENGDDDDDEEEEETEQSEQPTQSTVSVLPVLDPTVNRLATVNVEKSDDEDYDS